MKNEIEYRNEVRLNESNILKCCFTKVRIVDTQKTLSKIQKIFPKCLGFVDLFCYSLEISEYSVELLGEISRDIKIFHCKLKHGKFEYIACQDFINIYKIKTLDSILEMSSSITYNFNYGFCYIIESEYGYKIGMTKNLHSRTKTFNIKLPFEWVFVAVYVLKEYKQFEKLLHKTFDLKRINGEWFELSKEDFVVCDILYEKIKSQN